MNHATARTAFAALISTLGLTFFVTPAAQAHESPDVHVTGIDRWCRNEVTIYEFHLRNLGDQAHRGVRVRIRRDHGFTESFGTLVRQGWGRVHRIRVAQGDQARITFRSQRRVILSAEMVGDCRRTI